MNATNWSRARSDFNHAWLKNRFIVALSKARKVLEGAVEDEFIWDDLSALLAEWPARMTDAMQVLDDYVVAMNPSRIVADGIGENLNSETASWLADIASRRWTQTEKPEERITTARGAMDTMNAQIAVVANLIPDVRQNKSSVKFATAIIELQTAAFNLSEVLTALGSTRV